jgi:glycosyltransferase involved in cell wall biosynthesis
VADATSRDASGDVRRVGVVFDCLFPWTAGGAERLYARLAEVLVEQGVEVEFVTRRQWPEDEPPRLPYDVVAVWSGELYDEQGVRTPSSAVHFARGVYRHLRAHRHEFDAVVISSTPVLTLMAARAALVGSRAVPVVNWVEVWGWRKWIDYSGPAVGAVAWSLQAVSLRLGTVITAISPFTARRVTAYRRHADPLVLGLVDVSGVPEGRSAERPGTPMALFVGRHIADKRLETLPPAVLHARQELPDLTATVVGTGPETERVRAVVADLGLDDVVRFAGRVSDEELDHLMRTAAVLVQPSAREGFGLVVTEAASVGTPSVVVAGVDNAAVDLVDEGVNGFVAPSTEPTALGDAIVSAVRGGVALRRTTLAWYDRARERYGLEPSVRALLDRCRAALR